MKENGYAEDDIIKVAKSYELCTRVYIGLYRGSGKTLLAHCVGTASLAVWLKRPAATIAASVLHATYADGDFGINNPRKMLLDYTDEEIETLTRKYHEFKWAYSPQQIEELIDNLDKLNEIEKEACLIRLLNEVEEYIDHSTHYHGFEGDDGIKKGFAWRLKYMNDIEKPLRNLAEKLGYKELSDEIETLFLGVREFELSPSLRTGKTHMYKLSPMSYRIKISGVARKFIKTSKKIKSLGIRESYRRLKK